MMDRPAGCGQLDLLMRGANGLEPSRIPPPSRTEVVLLLTRLMAECIAVGTALPAEAGDE
jgi:hypothetical protein